MEHPFNVESPNREPLAALVTRVVDVETRIRSLQAERSTLLAQAHALAEREGLGSVERETGSLGANGEVSAANDAAAAGDLAVMPRSLSTRVALPRGTVTRRDRAHRVVRAEIAAALHVSEWCVGHDITHAVELLERCPALHTAQACGELTPRHIRSVVDAGRVIEHWATEPAGSTLTDECGQELTLEETEVEVARRHAQYAAAVLPYAQALTPAELVPVAKRLAEKFAGVAFDDRHQRAARDRRVWITDLDDGMSHLTAYLTSVEAHAIFDRLTQLGRHLQEDDVAGSGVTSVTSSGPATLVAPGADRTVAPRGVAVSGVDAAASEVPTEAEVAVTAEAVKRPLPEARADSLVSLLLTGETEPDPGATKRLGPRVSARVQVLVPVSLTGLLQRSKRGADGVLGITRVAAGPSEDAGATGGPADEVTAHASGQANGTPVAPDAFLFQPELVGVGPMDSDTAARIAHDASTWDLVVVDDGVGGIDTLGDVLTVEGYRVPAKLRRYLAARDQRCRFPGCTLPVFRCDIDHTIAAEDGGPTSTDNLGHLCRGHHVLKHHGGCLVVQRDRGEYDWTFPSGRRYTTKAPSKVTFSSAIGPPELRTTTRPRSLQTQTAADREKHPYGDDFDASLGLDESSEASRPPPEPPPF